PADAHWVIVLDRMPDERASRLRRFCARLGIEVTLVDAADVGFSELGAVKRRGHVSEAAFLRLFADRILPESADRVVYLDTDVVVREDVSRLFTLDLAGRAFAAAR